jgi:hypothetical protein
MEVDPAHACIGPHVRPLEQASRGKVDRHTHSAGMHVVYRFVPAHRHALHARHDLRPVALVEAGDDAHRAQRAIGEVAHRLMIARPFLHEERLNPRHCTQAFEEPGGGQLLSRSMLPVDAFAKMVPALCTPPAARAHRLHEQVCSRQRPRPANLAAMHGKQDRDRRNTPLGAIGRECLLVAQRRIRPTRFSQDPVGAALGLAARQIAPRPLHLPRPVQFENIVPGR